MSAVSLNASDVPGYELGGARPKSAIVLPDGRLAIAKFPKPDDTRDIAAGEILALTIAERAGIRVAEHQLVMVKGKGVSVITRFDRDGPHRIPFLSAGRSIKQSKTRLSDYEQTAGKRRAETEARSGHQVGDPVRGAAAIIKAVESKETPLRLLLGKPALDLAYKKLETLKANFDAWAETTRGADFPDAEVKKAI